MFVPGLKKKIGHEFAKESSFMPWIAVDHKMNTLKNFIVSTETFIFFQIWPIGLWLINSFDS